MPAPMAGLLPPTWETWSEFPAPSCSLAQLLWAVNQCGRTRARAHSLSLPLKLKKQTTKY